MTSTSVVSDCLFVYTEMRSRGSKSNKVEDKWTNKAAGSQLPLPLRRVLLLLLLLVVLLLVDARLDAAAEISCSAWLTSSANLVKARTYCPVPTWSPEPAIAPLPLPTARTSGAGMGAAARTTIASGWPGTDKTAGALKVAKASASGSAASDDADDERVRGLSTAAEAHVPRSRLFKAGLGVGSAGTSGAAA